MHHLNAAACQKVDDGRRNQRVRNQCADFLDGAADAAANNTEFCVISYNDNVGAFIYDHLFEFSNLAGIFRGARVWDETIAGEDGKVNTVEGGNKFLGKESDAGQRFPFH